MYVKAKDGVVQKFPYTLRDLRAENPNTSFPKHPSNELLAEWDVYPVVAEDAPEFQKGQVVEQAPEPVYSNGLWSVQYIVRDMTQEELNHQGELVRADRNRLLSESDWTQLPDAPVDSQAWSVYRQALRDITDDPLFPFVTFPEAPNV